jgi:hypothetical protein
MASPTYLQSINSPNVCDGDVATVACMETGWGGISRDFSVFVGTGVSVTEPSIFCPAGLTSFAMRVSMAAARSLDLYLVPIHPVTLSQFSDIPIGLLDTLILPGITSATGYLTWGNFGGSVAGGANVATNPFQLRWDNLGLSVTVSYTFWAFSTMRGGPINFF